MGATLAWLRKYQTGALQLMPERQVKILAQKEYDKSEGEILVNHKHRKS